MLGLTGPLLINSFGQLAGADLGGLQTAVGASPADFFWLITAFGTASFAGIVCAVPLITMFGIKRVLAGLSLTFAVGAFGCLSADTLSLVLISRFLQGFASGGLGPVAFVAVFMITGGTHRLPFGLALLALATLLPATLGPATARMIGAGFGWEALFRVQFGLSVIVCLAAVALLPSSPMHWKNRKTDWASIGLLSLGLASLVIVLGQGLRLGWLQNNIISWSLAVSAAAWAGFVSRQKWASKPLLNIGLMRSRAFIVPIVMNLIFRAGFAFTAVLVPQLFIILQGDRPVDLGSLYLYSAFAQVLAFPLTWWAMQRVDGRIVMVFGLMLFGVAAGVAGASASGYSFAHLGLALILAGAAQVIFLLPNLVAGAGPLRPADGATASIVFNASSIGGTILGVSLTGEMLMISEQFHRRVVAGGYGPTIETAAGASASITALADVLALVALLLVVSAAGVRAFIPQPALRPARLAVEAA